MRLFLSIALFIGLAFLAGCASLSKAQCQTGDWQQVGFNDGTRGSSSSRFAEHIEACSEHGIVVDRAQYMRGYENGLQQYCTPTNAAEVGVRGQSYNNVCQGERGVSFQRVYREANDVYLIDQTIQSIQGKIEELTEKLAAPATTPEERERLARDLNWLNLDLSREFRARSQEEREMRAVLAQEEARLARL